MGFYVNVKAKKGCEKQINEAWSSKFGDVLVYTKEIIKKEIVAHKKHQPNTHIKTVKDWNQSFPIHAEGRGQVFLRVFGYSEERQEEFIAESQEKRDMIQFILDNRFLFKSVSGLCDANDALDMDIKGDYMENGILEYDEVISFQTLPSDVTSKVYLKCLEIGNPTLWHRYLQFKETNGSKEVWKEIKHCVAEEGFGATVWQKWIAYQKFFGKRNENIDLLPFPSLLLIDNVITMSEADYKSANNISDSLEKDDKGNVSFIA